MAIIKENGRERRRGKEREECGKENDGKQRKINRLEEKGKKNEKWE